MVSAFGPWRVTFLVDIRGGEPRVWTHISYRAAKTMREHTMLDFREFQLDWAGCAEELLRLMAVICGSVGREKGWLSIWVGEQSCHDGAICLLIEL